MEIALLILAVVVLVAGLGVVVVNRRRSRGIELEPPQRGAVGRPSAPPRPSRPTAPPRPTTSQAPPAAPSTEEAPPELAPDRVEEIEEALAGVVVEEPVPEAPEAPPEAPPEPPPVVERPRFRDRLARARSVFAGAFGSVRGRGRIDEETWEDLEEALLRADVGVNLTMELLDAVRDRVRAEGITEPEALLGALKEEIRARLEGSDRSLRLAGAPGKPDVWLFVGVNGVGKTTTIGKVAARQAGEGHQVVMAAGDTFRAAAAEQLETWADRAGADLVRGAEGGDPSSVIFDAVQRAAAKGADLVLADTAGRLHTKVNLMEELRKVRRVADREPGTVTEVLLVLDATTGQNGLTQAKEFTQAVEVTGVVLTKLDGSAKGGIVLAIQQELGLPVKLVGLGETVADLVDFDPDEFVDALFAEA